ncbi:MAG TPA: GAF domain-containing protein [Candidatus Angelobacter sp.]
MSASPSSFAQIAAACEAEGLTLQSGEKIASALAAEFKVGPDEVGILRLEADSLVFVYPAKLHDVGRIPLNNSSSVAVRTLNTRRPEIMNNFTKTKHTTFFETVDISGKPAGPKMGREHQTIQKLMSAPVIVAGKVVGVIQISRKGATLIGAGPDFVAADLQKLVGLASVLAKCFRPR